MNEDMLAELQAEFVGEARELLETLQDRTMALSESAEKSVLDEIFRVLHNLKGTSQSVELPEFSSFVHKIEDQVQAVRANFVEGEAVAGDFIQFLLKSHDEVLNLVRKLEAGEKLTPEDLTGVPEAPKLDEQRPAVDGEVGNNEVQIAQGPEPALNSSFEQPMSSTDEDSLISEDLAAQSDEVSAQPLQTEKATSTAGASKSKAIKTQQFVKCPTSKISTMLNYLGETITLVNQINGDDLEQLERTRSSILKYINELHSTCLSLTSVPVATIKAKLQRAVNEASSMTGKPVDFKMVGDHLEVDKFILESLSDPLVHVVRNAVDHGIEDSPLARTEKEKPANGQVEVKFEIRSESILITIQDDGKGLDSDLIFKKAKSKGLVSEDTAQMSEKEKLNLIFLPGLSTRDNVSEISGRGVGMDVVARTIQSLKGTVEVSSRVGKGSVFEITIPMNITIYHGMIADCNGRSFIMRTSDVKGVVRPHSNEFKAIRPGVYHLLHDNDLYETVDLSNLFFGTNKELRQDEKPSVVICSAQGKQFGVLVDEVKSREKLVEKDIVFEHPFLGADISSQMFSGISILPNGKIGAVMNIQEINSRMFGNG